MILLTGMNSFLYDNGHAYCAATEHHLLTTYNEITKHFYLVRRMHLHPNANLNRAQAITLRQLQTKSYYSPVQISEWYGVEEIEITCKACNENACTLDHILWECGSLEPGIKRECFEKLIRSPAHDNQILAVQCDHDRARRLDLPVPS